MSHCTLPTEVWGHDLSVSSPFQPSWLWRGFLSRGSITLLTGVWKGGKSTLLSLLLARRESGAALAGAPVTPGKSVVITEESLDLWATRARSLGFGGNVCFFSRPFTVLPSPAQRQTLLNRVAVLHETRGIDLVAIDPLALFCPGEDHARGILEFLLPLTALAARGLAVLVLHHPAKGRQPPGQAARGGAALLDHIDISIDMRHPGGDFLTRRRIFFIASRHDPTPRRLVLELNTQATDYDVVPDVSQMDSQATWPILHQILHTAGQPLTRQQIIALWPPDLPKPARTTLWRLLDRAASGNLLSVAGSGRRNEPFRYWVGH